MKDQTSRIAFLILSHKNPDQINLLVDSLRSIYNCACFLHVDKKSAAIRNQIRTNNLTLLPEARSVDVRWGTFSQCEATFNLIDAALSSGQKFDYLWLISAQDLPIAKPGQTEHFLSDPSVPYMNVFGKGHPKYPAFAKRNDVYYPDFMLKRTSLPSVLRKGWKFISGGKCRTFPIFRRKSDFPYYFGSSWWTLPFECVKEMMALYRSSGKYLKLFRHAANPDESLFQTLFMQTSYAGRQKGILTYVDWSEKKASPKTFSMHEYAALKENSGKFLLGRKFDFSVDKQVCLKVLQSLCGIEGIHDADSQL